MKLNRKQLETTNKLIDWWDEEDLLNEGQAPRLKESLEIKTINWKKVAEYFMGLAVISVIVAFFTLVADEWILDLFERIFEISDVAVFFLLVLLTVFFYMAGWHIHRKSLKRSNLSLETLLLLGSISFGGALNYFGKFLEVGSFFEIVLVLVFAIQAFVVSWFFRSVLFSGIGWLSIMLWLGLESGRQGNWSGSWLGMNIALRYLFFSLVPLFTGLFLKNEKLTIFIKMAERTGWVFLLLSFWGLSLFGNHQSWDTWEAASAASLLPWGLFMGAASFALWLWGRKQNNKEWMWMGGLALIADAYTQYFLFLWDPLHPALFFAVMALSFWLLGRRAERIKR